MKLVKIRKILKEEMKKGISYPSARKNVIKSGLLDTPNNILAIEYIRQTNLPVKAIKRIGKGHDTDDELYSASAIRQTMRYLRSAVRPPLTAWSSRASAQTRT